MASTEREKLKRKPMIFGFPMFVRTLNTNIPHNLSKKTSSPPFPLAVKTFHIYIICSGVIFVNKKAKFWGIGSGLLAVGNRRLVFKLLCCGIEPKNTSVVSTTWKSCKANVEKSIFLVDDDDDDDYRHWTLRTDCFVGHCFAYMFCMSKFYLLVDFLDLFGDTKSPVMTNFAGCPVLIVLLHLQHLVLSTKMFKKKTPWKLTPKRPTRNEK